jgi:hypothetical protein
MKKLLLAIASFAFVLSINGQKRPLTGSGKIVEKKFDYSGFDKISISDLNGRVKIETGKSYSVLVQIDDNLEPLLETSVAEGQLKIRFKGNENNKLYIENTNIVILITLPEISVFNHKGNSDASINYGNGRYLRINNEGNGGIVVRGKVDLLDIINDGNGDVNASELTAIKAVVEKYGNGDIQVNVLNELQVTSRGNGDIINRGKADFVVKALSGNGKLLKKN